MNKFKIHDYVAANPEDKGLKEFFGCIFQVYFVDSGRYNIICVQKNKTTILGKSFLNIAEIDLVSVGKPAKKQNHPLTKIFV